MLSLTPSAMSCWGIKSVSNYLTFIVTQCVVQSAYNVAHCKEYINLSIIRPHLMHAAHCYRCHTLAWSVCLCVGHTGVPCING